MRKFIAVLCLVLLCGCAEGAVSPKTIKNGFTSEQLIEKVGLPQEKTDGPNGIEIWVYRNYPMDIYYYVKDGRVIDKKLAPNAAY